MSLQEEDLRQRISDLFGEEIQNVEDEILDQNYQQGTMEYDALEMYVANLERLRQDIFNKAFNS